VDGLVAVLLLTPRPRPLCDGATRRPTRNLVPYVPGSTSLHSPVPLRASASALPNRFDHDAPNSTVTKRDIERTVTDQGSPCHRRLRIARPVSSCGDYARRGSKQGGKHGERTIFVSDLSGDRIREGKAARITINFQDARKGTFVLDVTEEEAEELGRKGTKQARRGRRPKAAA
jgi:hypothetical protein